MLIQKQIQYTPGSVFISLLCKVVEILILCYYLYIMGIHHDLSEIGKWKAIGQWKVERTQEVFAEVFGVSKKLISRFWIRFMKTGDIPQRQGQGGSPLTIRTDDPYLWQFAYRYHWVLPKGVVGFPSLKQ